MKFLTLVFLIFLFHNQSIFSQSRIYDGSKDSLVEKPLSEKQIIMLEKRAKYRSEHHIKEKIIYVTKANKKGKIKFKRKIFKGEIFNKNGVQKSSKKFDYDGKLLKIEEYPIRTKPDKRKGDTKYKKEFQLDALSITYYSRLLDLRHYINDFNSYEVDSLNRISSWSVIRKNGLKKSEITYSYNIPNYSKEQTYYDWNEDKVQTTLTEYNINGFETKKYWFSNEGILQELSEYEYILHE